MTALCAARPGDIMGQDAALQVGTQLALGVRRDVLLFPVLLAQSEEGLQMILYRPVQGCVGGASAAVGRGRASLQRDGCAPILAWVVKL